MTFDDRAQAVMALGFTDRQARFLVTVALHSGYCLRRQYEAFAGVRSGQNVRAFLDGLVTRGVAERCAGRAGGLEAREHVRISCAIHQQPGGANPRQFPIDRVDEIKRKAQDAVFAALEDADLTFTAVPVARDNESVRERIMVIARNSGLAIHHVTVHDLGGKLTVSIDLEVDGGSFEQEFAALLDAEAYRATVAE